MEVFFKYVVSLFGTVAAYWLIGTGGLIVFIVLVVIWHKINMVILHRKIIQTYELLTKHKQVIVALPSVDACLLADVRTLILREEYQFFTDGPGVLILQHKQVPVAIIAFFATTRRLSVVQMQGVTSVGRVYINREALDALYFSTIEGLARALEVQEVRILAAEANRWYHNPEGVRFDMHELHRTRMRRAYNELPALHGFVRKRKWWYKKRQTGQS